MATEDAAAQAIGAEGWSDPSGPSSVQKKPKIEVEKEETPPEVRGSDDSDFGDWGTEMDYVVIPDEAMERYEQQVKESGGYGVVDYIDGMRDLGMITPISDYFLENPVITKLAEKAIAHYNEDRPDGLLKFVKIMNMNQLYGIISFMTVKAEDTVDHQIKEYLVQVETNFGTELKVLEFKPKPDQEIGTEI